MNNASNPKRIPLTIARAALMMAKSRVFVRNELSHACIRRTPDAINIEHPMKLRKISILLCMGALIRIPGNKIVEACFSKYQTLTTKCRQNY